jgi:hypothetical protein
MDPVGHTGPSVDPGLPAAHAFARGYVVAVIPLALLFLPLLAHRSPDPAVLTYSARYDRFLVLAALVVAGVPLIIGIACHRSRSVGPAYGLVLALTGFVVGCVLVEAALTYRPNPKGAEFIASVIADRWPEKP